MEEEEEEEEEGIKTFRRENDKIAEEGINKIQEGKMWWWLYIVSPSPSCVEKKLSLGSMMGRCGVDVGSIGGRCIC